MPPFRLRNHRLTKFVEVDLPLLVRQSHTIRPQPLHDLIPLAGVAFTKQPRRAMGQTRLPVRRRKSLPVRFRLSI